MEASRKFSVASVSLGLVLASVAVSHMAGQQPAASADTETAQAQPDSKTSRMLIGAKVGGKSGVKGGGPPV